MLMLKKNYTHMPIYEVQRNQIWSTPIITSWEVIWECRQISADHKYFKSIQVDTWEWSKMYKHPHAHYNPAKYTAVYRYQVPENVKAMNKRTDTL